MSAGTPAAGRRAAVTALAVIAVGIVAAALVGMGPDVVLLAAAGLLCAAGWWFLSGVLDRTTSTGGVAAPPATPPPARIDHRLMTLRNGIAYGRAHDASTARLRDALVELVDDQLRAVHDIDRATQPAEAAATLGAELSSFVEDSDSARRLTRPRDLDRIVTLIEQL